MDSVTAIVESHRDQLSRWWLDQVVYLNFSIGV